MGNLFSELGQKINQTARSKGWHPLTPRNWKHKYRIPASLALVHSELSEALEDFRKGDLEGFKSELADAIIRILGEAEGLKIDLLQAVLDKMAKNEGREHKHGGKII